MLLHLLFVLLISLFGYFLLINYAEKYYLIDVPNNRSSHNNKTPKGFGIIIFLACLISLLIFESSLLLENSFFFISVFLVLILGIHDDIKDSSPIVKIVIPIFAYFFVYLDGYLIDSLGVYLGMNVDLHNIFSIIFTLFALIAYTNAFNLIDGLDGLSGLLGIIILTSFAYIGHVNNDKFLLLIPLIIISSLIVFLIFNWNPAKVFLGDSGSLLIGFIISILGIRSLDFIQPIAILYIAAIPIFDSIVVFFRRLNKKQNPFQPDRTHLHHNLLFRTKNVKKTVLIMAMIQICFSIIGLTLIVNIEDSFISLIIFLIFLFTIYLLTKNYEEKNV